MTAPTTIRPQRTATPTGIPGLVDAEILAVNLAYTIEQIQQNAPLNLLQMYSLLQAAEAVKQCQEALGQAQVLSADNIKQHARGEGR